MVCVHRWHSEICNNVYGFYRINKVHCCETQIGPFGAALFAAALNNKALVGDFRNSNIVSKTLIIYILFTKLKYLIINTKSEQEIFNAV